MDVYTVLCLKWITNKDLLYSTWNSVQCYVAAWMGGQFGGESIHVYMRLSPFTLHLKLSQYCQFCHNTVHLGKSRLTPGEGNGNAK